MVRRALVAHTLNALRCLTACLRFSRLNVTVSLTALPCRLELTRH